MIYKVREVERVDTDTETLEFALRPTSPAIPTSYDPALVFCLRLEPETMPVSLCCPSVVAENIITRRLIKR